LITKLIFNTTIKMFAEMYEDDDAIFFEDTPNEIYYPDYEDMDYEECDDSMEECYDEIDYFNCISSDEKIILEQYINNVRRLTINNFIDCVFPEATQKLFDIELTPELLTKYLKEDEDFLHLFEELVHIKLSF
jgi:hypothetical protein